VDKRRGSGSEQDVLHITGNFTLHNHPSGDPTPSREDIAITARLRNAGDILGISLKDHVIIGDSCNYVSLLEKGVL
jgi:DNA repair protein RadC